MDYYPAGNTTSVSCETILTSAHTFTLTMHRITPRCMTTTNASCNEPKKILSPQSSKLVANKTSLRLRLRLHHSKSLRIHTKIVFGFVGGLRRKKYLEMETVLSYLRMDVSPRKFCWMLPWPTEKFPSIFLFVTICHKNVVHYSLLLLLFTKTRKTSPES